jgi:hypothetical protein
MATLARGFEMDLGDNLWKRRELRTELADFDRLASEKPVVRRGEIARFRESKPRNAA